MKILVIEDDPRLCENIHSYFKEDVNIYENACSFSSAIRKLSMSDYDCIILDIGLPENDGYSVLEFLGQQMKHEAVIIILAKDSYHQTKELNIGAEDYIAQPFHVSELKARVLAIFRQKITNRQSVIEHNEITIDLIGRAVEVNNVPVMLTGKEYELLLYFIVNKGVVVSKAAIASHLKGEEMDVNNCLDFIYTHIKNLRKKLSGASAGDYLKSVYGIGYKFALK